MIGHNSSLMKMPWMHIKLTLVILLAGYTGFIGATRRKFENDVIAYASKTCRMLNEVPTLFLFGIIFLMVVFRFKMGA